MNCPFCIKKCSKCGRLLVASKLNFNNGTGKYKLRAECRACQNKYSLNNNKMSKKIKRTDNPFDSIDTNKTWNNCPFCIKICIECKGILVANKMNFHKKEGGKYKLTSRCKQCQNKYISKFERKKYDNKKYKYKRKPRNAKQQLLHRESNAKWKKNNPDKVFNQRQRRRELEKHQGRGFIDNSWYEMMEFFDWKCAYSGEKLTNDNRTIDHIISLKCGGLNEIWNLIPCHSSYNSSKNIKDMITWYKKQDFFDIDRLMKIYEWQEYAFEKWGKSKE